jgi:alanine racemase
LTACLSSIEDAQNLSLAAEKLGRTARAQLKINTGMGRLGVEADVAVETATQIQALSKVELTGAFTHFASAGERDTGFVHTQYGRFQPLVQLISRATNLPPQLFHCANSAALLRFPSMRLSCVRPGTILYGQFPSPLAAEAAQGQHFTLRDGFSVKARIVAIKDLKIGQSVGYGPEWKATRPARIATIAVGYADGLTLEPHARTASWGEVRRSMQNTAKRAAQWYGVRGDDASRTVKINGEVAPIIGRIAMQQCSIDITHLPHVQIGDAVSVWMRRLTAGAHLPRVYVEE